MDKDAKTEIQINQFLELPFYVREQLLAATVKPEGRRSKKIAADFPCEVIQTSENIINIVCQRLRVNIEELGSKSRKAELVIGRHIICYLLRGNEYGVKQIGKMINRDHSTVLYACESHQERIDSDIDYKNKYRSIVELLKEL